MSFFPASMMVTAKLDDNPRYKGSVHDDEVARAQGFRAALIPGAFVYDYVTRLAVRAWGMDWIARGAVTARFRRPAYDGDVLTVSAVPGPVVHGGPSAEVGVSNQDGETVLVGTIGLPQMLTDVPDISQLEFLPSPEPRPSAGAEDVMPGLRFGTVERVLTEEDVAASRAAMANHEPIYSENGIAHSGCMVRLTMGDVLSSYKFPLAPVFTAVETRNLAPLRAGRRISTSARVTKVFTRNGRRYFESEEYLVADRREVVARHVRTNLFASD
ncbi:MaoC family dehydratase [Chelativorans sp. AA-79]|uniref:MaoC family dehydratase n=1 Tax=Chelativorans sp. AA-79 TaxID=3028735 RepID=UPI0023F70F77|nr:MaoC family dehydratase [Chelativorans sp. AA-79]WEX09108.1 MaoC family dehydratase [Chelativorans sp. AA-79]